MTHLAEQAGFGGYAYLHIRPSHTVAASNYHPEWRKLYFQRKFEAIDPIGSRAKSLKQVFASSGEQERKRLSKEEREFFDRAAVFGIRSGITIPIKAANGSTSMFTLASDTTSIQLERDINPIAAAAVVGQFHKVSYAILNDVFGNILSAERFHNFLF